MFENKNSVFFAPNLLSVYGERWRCY